jgi:hypothetical protein
VIDEDSIFVKCIVKEQNKKEVKFENKEVELSE